jgi:hypothetical protein
MSAHKADVDNVGRPMVVSSDKELLEAAKDKLEILDPEAEDAMDSLRRYYALK